MASRLPTFSETWKREVRSKKNYTRSGPEPGCLAHPCISSGRRPGPVVQQLGTHRSPCGRVGSPPSVTALRGDVVTRAAIVLLLMVLGSGTASAQECLHGSNVGPMMRARRERAIQLAVRINQAQSLMVGPRVRHAPTGH